MANGSEPPAVPEKEPSSTESTFSTPTGMVALGGVILVATYVIFGLLLNDYWVGWIAMTLAISAILLLRAGGSFVEKLAPVAVLAKTVGYLLAIVGLLVLVEDLRFFDNNLDEFPDVIGALASYAGYVIAFLGARSIKT
jgi:hypothetical protein